MKKGKIVSGMRPTGKMHLGHLHGALLNWKKLQEKYNCFYFIADWHALTSEYAHPDIIRESTYDIIIDWISVGLDPEVSTFFIQSEIKEHAELYLIFSMITPLPWLERNPTYQTPTPFSWPLSVQDRFSVLKTSSSCSPHIRFGLKDIRCEWFRLFHYLNRSHEKKKHCR